MKKTESLKYFITFILWMTVNSLIGQIEISDFEYPSAGMDDGSITIRANGDAGPFTISINEVDRPPCVDIVGKCTFDNLPAGTYIITVSDRLGCEVELEIEFNPTDCDLSAEIASVTQLTKCTEVRCADGGTDCCPGHQSTCTDDGAIEITVETDHTFTVYLNGTDQGSNTSFTGLSFRTRYSRNHSS